MELNREQIIKALECISRTEDVLCEGCDYRKYDGLACHRIGAKNALALINELTEENERLTSLCVSKDVIIGDMNAENERLRKANEYYSELEQGCYVTGVKKVISDTVRKMSKRIKEYFPYEADSGLYVVLDQIEKEMLENADDK